jgi:hypothetical protein
MNIGSNASCRLVRGAGWIIFLALLNLSARPCCGELSRAQADALQQKIRVALDIPQTLPALNPQSYGSFEPVPGVIADRVTYRTQYGLLVPAIVYRPAGVRGRIPGIVLVNGHGADKASWYSWYTGVLYAKAGAAVLTYDPIGEGERNDQHKDGAGEHDQPIDLPGVPERMGGSMIVDVMQAVSYLDSLSYVDSRRIGVLGFSMGSFVVSLAGALDNRIRAVLLTGGGDLDGPGGYWDSSRMLMCQSGPYHALSFLGDRPAVLFALQALRGPTFIFNGTADTVVAIPQHGPDFFNNLRSRTIALLGSDRNVFTTAFDEGASHRPAWINLVCAAWLADNLRFANWNRKKIAKLPTIRIGDWAKANGVDFNKSAQRVDRDAGLVSVDVGVPHLTPEQLSVLPRNEWERRRTEFVYSSWVKAAIADAHQGLKTVRSLE